MVIHDLAESQVCSKGDRQTSIRDLANQRTVRAGVRAAAPHHQEAGQYACRCAGVAARDIWKLMGTEKRDNQVLGGSTPIHSVLRRGANHRNDGLPPLTSLI